MTDVHYREVAVAPTACGLTDERANGTTDRGKLTCTECKLEQPMQDAPGRVEYRIPDQIVLRDRQEALREAIERREHAARGLALAGRRLEAAMRHEKNLLQSIIDVRLRMKSGEES